MAPLARDSKFLQELRSLPLSWEFSPPITNSVTWLAVYVEDPTTNIGVVTATGTSVVPIAWVIPLITIAFLDTGRINVVGGADSESERTMLPPGVSVELPMIKFDDGSPVIIEVPTVNIGTVTDGGVDGPGVS